MPTPEDIDAAVDHLRRVKNGENPVDVYGTAKPPLWFKGSKWTAADAEELAEAGIQSDQEDLADAYLDLGTLETTDAYRLEGGKKFRVTTFIREVQP